MSLRVASILALSLVAAGAAGARAETADDALEWHEGPRNSITTDPILMAVGILNLSYERAIGRTFSVQAGVLAMGSGDDGILLLTLHPHAYLGNSPLSGLYIAPLVQVGSSPMRALFDPNESGDRGFGAGATVGYAWVSGAATLQLGIGGEVAWISGGTGVFVGPAADLSAGVAF